jgi:AraC-like DNA-binding protein
MTKNSKPITANFEIEEQKEASYRKLVNPQLMEQLKEKILHELLVRKKYRDHGYTARDLAHDLETNTRYISAAVRVHFHTNYSTLVNKYRVEEAMSALTDSRYAHLSVEEIGDMVGFEHRQSFHTAFAKYAGITPKAYRKQFEQQLASITPVKKKKER